MIENLNQTIAYICPECSAITEKKINVFEFSGNKVFNLFCGEKNCRLNAGCIAEYHGKYRISLPCTFCGEVHEIIINKSSFWKRDFFAFKCPNTDFDLFFIGNSKKIKAAVSRQEEIFSEAEEELMGEVPLIYDIMMRLQDLFEASLIVCSCGCADVFPEPDEKGIKLVCGKCGKQKIIPVTEEEYESLLDTMFIKL